MAENITAEYLRQLDQAQTVALIEHHNHLYWDLGEPEISDDQYDLLMRRLAEFDPAHPLLAAVHAAAVAGSGKVRHTAPMLSLDKAYSLDEVMEWVDKYSRSPAEKFLIQPKYDGISANYADGVLATRGDGEEGENITGKLPLLELETTGYRGPVDRPVRGEIVIRDDVFREKYPDIAKKDGKPYKNSRNAVAGIMGLKEIDEILEQLRRHRAWLTLVDYDMVSYTVTQEEFRARWQDIVTEIEALPYPMDGIVIKLADTGYSRSLGNTAHHPRGQIAFKFSGIRQTSRLLDVEWSFGKNCLTPVARIEPVDIGGITIRHATLHNAQNIIDKDIHIGDTVTVERAGDVIPYIVAAEPGEERRSAMIERCPCATCKTALLRRGPELYCPNPDCFETRVQRLTAAVRNIGIERLGEPNIRRMMQTLGIRTLKDIFNLSTADILKLEGFKEKSAANLYGEIRKAETISDYQFLAAMNIPGIGPNLARLILSAYSLAELRELSEEQLAEMHGIGPERAAALVRELREQREFIDEMLACVNLIPTGNASAAAARPTVCFTGKMPEKRSYYEKLAEQHGYQSADAVTKELSLLVAADPAESGGKLDKARKSGVRILALDEWLASLTQPVETAPAPATPPPQAEKMEATTTAPADAPSAEPPRPPEPEEPSDPAPKADGLGMTQSTFDF